MAVISFKCPNCDGELVFEPSSQQYECPYCSSHFTQEQIDEMQPQKQPSREIGAAAFGGGRQEFKSETASGGDKEDTESEKEDGGEAVVYSCPSCGAEIVTDATTAATFCYYCHNPVVLSGRLSGKYLPEWIIPFSIDRQKAEHMFLEAVGKKKFIPKDFFTPQQIEKLSGVYFPYWMVDWKGRGQMEAGATKVRVWRSGDREFTETQFFQVYREGEVEFPQLSRNALQKANRMLVEGVQPYRQDEAKKFSMGYLSGFQAEKRDMEREAFQSDIQQEVREYTSRLLRESAHGYTTVTPKNTDVRTVQEEWDYVLVPVWALTYQGKNGKMYYYAINGQTGKVCGELPVSYRKVGTMAAVITVVVFLLALLGGYLI